VKGREVRGARGGKGVERCRIEKGEVVCISV
jgi:hypothetical protein